MVYAIQITAIFTRLYLIILRSFTWVNNLDISYLYLQAFNFKMNNQLNYQNFNFILKKVRLVTIIIIIIIIIFMMRLLFYC